MTDRFTLEELQNLMLSMNADGCTCKDCANLRVKLEMLIKREQEKPIVETKDIGGHTVTVERNPG